MPRLLCFVSMLQAFKRLATLPMKRAGSPLRLPPKHSSSVKCLSLLTTMRMFRCFTLVAFLTTAIATPLLPCSLNPRNQLCDNSLTTKADTQVSNHCFLIQPQSTLPAADPLPRPLIPRTLPSSPFTWHVVNTDTSLRITLIRKIPGLIVLSVLEDVMTYATEHIAHYQDSNIAGGSFEWNGPQDIVFQLVNANNHQTTWGVLGTVAVGLRNYFLSSPTWPGRLQEGNMNGYALYFSVTDGGNVVGVGSIG